MEEFRGKSDSSPYRSPKMIVRAQERLLQASTTSLSGQKIRIFVPSSAGLATSRLSTTPIVPAREFATFASASHPPHPSKMMALTPGVQEASRRIQPAQARISQSMNINQRSQSSQSMVSASQSIQQQSQGSISASQSIHSQLSNTPAMDEYNYRPEDHAGHIARSSAARVSESSSESSYRSTYRQDDTADWDISDSDIVHSAGSSEIQGSER